MHFLTCCVLDMLHSDAFLCIQKARFMLMHSPRDAYVSDALICMQLLYSCILVHSGSGAFIICITVHSQCVAFFTS